MKTTKVLFALLSISAFLFISVMAGCKKQDATNANTIVNICDTLPCHNGAACNQGVCQCVGNFNGVHCDSCKYGFRGAHCDSCITGYEGTNCNVLSSAKFVGSYSGSDTCSGSIYPDNWIISAGQTLTQLEISVAGVTLTADFSGNTFTIPSQSHSGLTFNSGTGVVNGNHIVITYNYSNSSSTQTCTFGGTK